METGRTGSIREDQRIVPARRSAEESPKELTYSRKGKGQGVERSIEVELRTETYRSSAGASAGWQTQKGGSYGEGRKKRLTSTAVFARKPGRVNAISDGAKRDLETAEPFIGNTLTREGIRRRFVGLP